jgi:hypothetical protein
VAVPEAIAMTKSQRSNLHRAINALTPEEVGAIVRRTYRLKANQDTDTIAKKVIAAAHRQVSPRKTTR